MQLFELNRLQTLALASLIVLIHALIGHFLAPFGLLMTVGIIPSFVLLLGSSKPNWGPLGGCALFFILFAVSDVLQKLYAGGRHDGQGQGWVFMTTMIGLLTAAPLLFIWLKQLPAGNYRTKTAAFILLVMLIAVHLRVTVDIGLGRSYWYEWNDLY